MPTNEERLDSHANAIRTLRAQVRDLTERLDALTSAGAPSGPVLPVAPPGSTPSQGVYVPNPHCLVCGEAKPPGRLELTCKPCGKKRNDIAYTKGADRAPILTATCGNCSMPKRRTIAILCPPCSEAYTTWRASQ